MRGSTLSMQLLGYTVEQHGISNLRFHGGRGVHIGYDCIGYGILSFWYAFILANRSVLMRKVKWLVVGTIVILAINVIRINMLLIAVNGIWPALLNLDSHFWFNVVAYLATFIMIYLYDLSCKKDVRARS